MRSTVVIFAPHVSIDSFPVVESSTYVIIAVVGGPGTVWGGVTGAVVDSAHLQALNPVSSQLGLSPTAGEPA
jgi:branched-chain amino acid transport system permease protein